jgi:bla regulator protein blaR1
MTKSVLAAAVLAGFTAAQSTSPAKSPAFEVASVKPNTSGDGRVLMMPQPGGRLNLVNVPLRLMIRNAYRVQDFQIVGGPDWLSTARFDVVAKAEGGNPSQEELQLMLRSLLADRFQLVVRPDKREMPTYSLVPARGDGKTGAHLRKSDANCGPATAPGAPPAPGQLPACGFMLGFGNLKARGSTMPALASTLSTFAGRIVVDRTGLAGGYDVDLNWTPDQIPRPAGGGDQPVQVNGVTVDPNGPSLFTALQEQLGLKLESTKGPVDVLVVERAEKPAED